MNVGMLLLMLKDVNPKARLEFKLHPIVIPDSGSPSVAVPPVEPERAAEDPSVRIELVTPQYSESKVTFHMVKTEEVDNLRIPKERAEAIVQEWLKREVGRYA